MREIRTSGSEGGGVETNRCSLPLSSSSSPSGLLAHRPEPLHGCCQHLVARPTPPLVGKNLDLLDAVVTRRLDHPSDRREIDDTVAHHAAVHQHMLRRDQPVADVVGDDALAGTGDLDAEFRVPPYM